LLQDKCLTIFNPFPKQDPCLYTIWHMVLRLARLSESAAATA